MHKNKGLTLIELLVVTSVIGILAAIAYPSYQNHLYKTRRSDGQQKLLLFASELEDYYLKNHTYENFNSIHHHINSDFYHFKILQISANTYTLIASPKPNQARDLCGVLSITDKQIMGPRMACWE